MQNLFHIKQWNVVTYLCHNLSILQLTNFEVKTWIINYIPHETIWLLTYPCPNLLCLFVPQKGNTCLADLSLEICNSSVNHTAHFLATQIAKTLGSTSIRHRSDTSVSDQCLINVDPRVFAIWIKEVTHNIWSVEIMFATMVFWHVC